MLGGSFEPYSRPEVYTELYTAFTPIFFGQINTILIISKHCIKLSILRISLKNLNCQIYNTKLLHVDEVLF